MNGEWRMENGEWRMENREWRFIKQILNNRNRINDDDHDFQ